jgi:hypothetical protein
MDKQEWLEMWKLSGEAGERAWQDKLQMHERAYDSHIVIPDIQPYKTVTGEVVNSRKQHREFLKRNDLVEIGNEKGKPKEIPDVPGRREAIVDALRKHKVRGFH